MEHPELALIENLTFKKPGAHALSRLTPFRFKRDAPTAALTKAPGNKCAWCNAAPIRTSRAKYCSRDCAASAMMFCYSQHDSTKGFVFIYLQNCACAGCGLDFWPDIKKLILRRSELYGPKLSLGQVMFNTGDILHVDHKIPIFKGGQGIGLSNIQVLCVACHRTKTVEERK